MKITCANVYELPQSIVASGLPMQAEYSSGEFGCAVQDLVAESNGGDIEANKHYQRAMRLAAMPDGSGHKTFLAGILVAANITATQVWWLQFGRYHHAQIVSSQSKMHRLRQMIGSKQPEDGGKYPFAGGNADLFHAFYDAAINGPATDEGLAMMCPMGLMLTARITTNYLQLATMWRQRRHHKLSEWQEFCDWVETLPMAIGLICGGKL